MAINAKLLHLGKLRLCFLQFVLVETSGTCIERWPFCDDVMLHPVLVYVHGLEAGDEEFREISNDAVKGVD